MSAEISLKIKSDFEKAAADFKKIDMSSESFQKSLAKLQTQMANGSIDKFMQKNQLAATAMTAAKGATAGLEKELSGLQSEIQRLIKSGLDPMNPALDKMKNRMSEIQGQLPQSTSRFGALGNAVTALGVGFGAYQIANKIYDIGKASLAAAANMEQQTVAFTTMLGSAEKAKSLLSDMQKFAESTPFEFTEIVDAGKKMIAFGFSSEEVVDKLRMLGDVSAGLGQPLGDMTYLFGQIKTQGRAMTQDLMQFANRGVPIYDELSKVLGVSASKVKDYASQGKIGFSEIEKVFKNLTSEGGKFAGLMDAQSQTIAGQWSNLNDQMDKTAIIIGKEMMPVASDLMTILSSGLQKISSSEVPDSITMTGSIIKDIKNMLDGTADTVESIGRSIGDAKVSEVLDEVRMWEASSDGVSKHMTDILNKHGKAAGAAGLYSEYVKGSVDLTGAQVKQLEAILGTYKGIAPAAKDELESWKQRGMVIDAVNKKAGSVKSGGGSGGGVAKTEDQIFQDRLNKMAMSENAAYQQRLNMASSFYEQRLALEGAKTEEEVQLWSQAQVRDIENSKMTAAQKIIAIEAVNKAVKKSAENQMANYAAFGNHMLSNTGSMLTDLQTVFKNAGKESRTLAYMLKGVSAAEAAINSYVAFTRALAAFPPPFNYVAAGITLAAGLAKQAAILSTPISAETGLSNYTVPDVRGNRNDGAPVMAQGGEKVTVTPRGEDMTQATNINISIDEAVLFSVVQRGIKTGQINLNNKNVGRGVFAN